MGLVPVTLLALAVAASALVGLSSGNNSSTWSVADELGCEHVSTTQPRAGEVKATCTYHGDTVVILSPSKGSHVLYPPSVPQNFILTPEGRAVVIGCQSRDDCIQIHQQVGGNLNSGPLLGLSLVIG